MRTYKEFSFNIAEDGLSEGHLGGRIKEDRVADAIKARGEKPNIKTRGQQAKKERDQREIKKNFHLTLEKME